MLLFDGGSHVAEKGTRSVGSHTHMVHSIHRVHGIEMSLMGCSEVVSGSRGGHLVKVVPCVHIGGTRKSESHRTIELAARVGRRVVDPREQHVTAPSVVMGWMVAAGRWYEHAVGLVALEAHVPAEEVIPGRVAGQM